MSGASGGVDGLAALLSPASIAVIGASEDPETLSGRPLQILAQHGYTGAVYPVNPRHRSIGGIPAFPSIGDVPGPVDL
ncbi:MAG: CoA-binding protein, partial [Acidimicrobiales bacterium]